MSKSNTPSPRGTFGLARRWICATFKRITARSTTSEDARAGLSFYGKSSYGKPHLTFAQQVTHLRDKGMVIENEPHALARLAQVGYYRLSAYWHPYKDRGHLACTGNESLRPGTRFSYADLLYEYDRRLRLLVLEGIEIIEIALRVDIAYLLGQRDRFAYMQPERLDKAFLKVDANGDSDYTRWLKGYQEKLHRPNEDFTKHLIGKYGEPLPIWASVELWELNQLCFFLRGLKHADKLAIASRYGLPCAKTLLSWMKAIKGLRNHAAHHGRIWNRNMAAQPMLPDKGVIPTLDFIAEDPSKIRQARVCCPLLLMDHMIRKIDPASTWPTKLRNLVQAFPAQTGMSIEHMGFPPGWPTEQDKSHRCG